MSAIEFTQHFAGTHDHVRRPVPVGWIYLTTLVSGAGCWWGVYELYRAAFT